MRDMVDNARKIVLSVQIPVFADADTGYGDAISTHYTVREYVQAGIAGAHIEDQTFPPKSGPRRRCISIQEMVGKLRAAMDAKQALDPDFVIMARCDLGGVPGASFAEIIERCQAYKAEAQVDVICPNGLRTWEEIQAAIRLIPGPVVPLIPADLSPYPSLQAQQDAGAAAAWFPALTTMAGLQANWDFLSDFRRRGTLALDELRAQAAQSPGASPAMAAFWTSRVCAQWRRCIFQTKTKAARRCPGLSEGPRKEDSPAVRDALFTAVVAEAPSCSFAGREIRRAGCCGVYLARRSRPASRTAASQSRAGTLVLNDALFPAGVVWCAALASAMGSSVVDAAASDWQ